MAIQISNRRDLIPCSECPTGVLALYAKGQEMSSEMSQMSEMSEKSENVRMTKMSRRMTMNLKMLMFLL